MLLITAADTSLGPFESATAKKINQPSQHLPLPNINDTHRFTNIDVMLF